MIDEAIQRMKRARQQIGVLTDDETAINLTSDLGEAIKAMEKQKKEQPKLWGDGYSEGELVYDMWDCPRCGQEYEIEFEKYDYCPKCGQRIKWEESR